MKQDSVEASQEEKEGSSRGKSGERRSIVEAVATPLSFFALLVTAAETILTIAVARSKLSEWHQFWLFCLIAAMLGAEIIIVALLTLFRPRHLSPQMAHALETSEEAIKLAKDVQKFLNRKAFADAVEDVLAKKVKPEALVKTVAK